MHNLFFNSKAFCLLIIFTTISSISCSKRKGCTDINSIKYDSEAEVDDGSCIYGGDNGHNSITIYLKGRLEAVINKSNYLDSAYVKFNAVEFPNAVYPFGGDPSAYDKIYVGIVGDSTVTVSGLKKGKYAIYVTGFDSSAFNHRVSYPLLYEFYNDSSTVFKKLYMNPICCTF